MQRRFPITAVACIVMASLALFVRLILRPVFDVIVYAIAIFLFGEAIAEWQFLYDFIVPVAIIVFMIAIPFVSIRLRTRGSDRIYFASKRICEAIITVYITPILFLVFILFGMYPLDIAWRWCNEYGEIPFVMLLFLVPVFFVFSCRVKFRATPAVGNTALVVSFVGIIRTVVFFFEGIDLSNDVLWLVVYSLSFIVLWLFEQLQRDKDGRINVLSRILLTVISSLSACIIGIKTVSIVYDLVMWGFSWADLNSLLFLIPIFALFVAYIVKVNRRINQFKEAL